MTKKFQRLVPAFLAGLTIACFSFFSSQIFAQDRTLIVTGFEPFHGESTNPSWEAVQLLPDQIAGVKLIKIKLPVRYRDGFLPLEEAIKQHKPIGILATGVADITGYHVEQRAYNQDDDIWADNENVVRRAWPGIPAPSIIPGAPSSLEASLFPAEQIVHSLTTKGVPATKSTDPYRFLCNHVFYLMLHDLAQSGTQIPAGFIHVPPLTQRNVAQDEIVLEEAIRTILFNLPKSG